MKAPLFEFPFFKYQLEDWDFKKKGLLARIKKQEFYRTPLQFYETDRLTNNKTYVRYLEQFLTPVLGQFCEEAKITCSLTDAWCVKYQKGDYQLVHNHRGWGFSAIMFVEYDPKVHKPPGFVAPWQNPRNDTTEIQYPKDVEEGTIIIFPSYGLHFVEPNPSRKQRTVVSFDLLPELPPHQSMNKTWISCTIS